MGRDTVHAWRHQFPYTLLYLPHKRIDLCQARHEAGYAIDPAFDVNKTKKNGRIDLNQRNTRCERLTCVQVIDASYLADHVQVEASAVPRAKGARRFRSKTQYYQPERAVERP